MRRGGPGARKKKEEEEIAEVEGKKIKIYLIYIEREEKRKKAERKKIEF